MTMTSWDFTCSVCSVTRCEVKAWLRGDSAQTAALGIERFRRTATVVRRSVRSMGRAGDRVSTAEVSARLAPPIGSRRSLQMPDRAGRLSVRLSPRQFRVSSQSPSARRPWLALAAGGPCRHPPCDRRLRGTEIGTTDVSSGSLSAPRQPPPPNPPPAGHAACTPECPSHGLRGSARRGGRQTALARDTVRPQPSARGVPQARWPGRSRCPQRSCCQRSQPSPQPPSPPAVPRWPSAHTATGALISGWHWYSCSTKSSKR